VFVEDEEPRVWPLPVKADPTDESACLARVFDRPLIIESIMSEWKWARSCDLRLICPAHLVDFCVTFEEYKCRPVIQNYVRTSSRDNASYAA
jgi:hypothetical protein